MNLKLWFNRQARGFVRCAQPWCWRARTWDSRCDRHSRYTAQQRLAQLREAARKRLADFEAREREQQGTDR